MSGAFFRRKFIRLTEEVETDFLEDIDAQVIWTAEFNDRISTGQVVSLSRTGGTAAEAQEKLEQAMIAQGWEPMA